MKKTRQGQIIVEALYGVLMLGWLIMVFIGVTHLFLWKMRAHSIGRLGTTLLVQEGVGEEQVLHEMNSYKDQFLIRSALDIEFQQGRYLSTPASRFYHLYYTQVRLKILSKPLKKMNLDKLLNHTEWVVAAKSAK